MWYLFGIYYYWTCVSLMFSWDAIQIKALFNKLKIVHYIKKDVVGNVYKLAGGYDNCR